jgi:hypothetical protein
MPKNVIEKLEIDKKKCSWPQQPVYKKTGQGTGFFIPEL